MSNNNNSSKKSYLGLDDFGCGVCGGIAKVLAGHPFDTLKGRVQTGVYGASPLEALRGTIKNEGALALYKGLAPPCIAVGFVSGTLFFVNGRVKKLLQPDPKVPLTYGQMLIAAGCGGAAVGCVVTPFEVLKLNRQVATAAAKSGSTSTTAPTSIAAIRQHSAFSLPRSLYCGFGATLIREAGTFGFFFPINEYFRAQMKEMSRNPQEQNLPIYIRVICAGVSGMICWFPFYPIDQVKTRIQTQSFAQKKMITMREAFLHLYKNEGGVKRLYRGLTPCLIRAFPAYAAQYITYETALKMIHQ
jgi:solute carrier family 25 carnitine/acylcarnitine transporter 20/29